MSALYCAQRRRQHRCRSAAGFTLLEMLIAMTLLGFILALLFGALRLGSRSWDAGETRSIQSTHMALTQAFLRRELSQIHPFRWKRKADTDLAFVGEANVIKMVAPVVARLGPGGLYLVSLELSRPDSGEGAQLIMKRAIPDLESVDFSALDEAEKVVLAEQVESLELAYFGSETAEAEPQWHQQWDSKDVPRRLPYLIRLKLKFMDGHSWPDLVIAPTIGFDTGCAWDTKTVRCIRGQ
ncbi:MAG: prepilin-type N-terminal cleavage/methylation domain-containing protein [Pseudomonadota bacterium]